MDSQTVTPKRANSLFIVTALAGLLAGPTAALAQDNDGIAALRRAGRTFAAIAEKASPAVVVLRTDTHLPREQSDGRQSRRPGPQGNRQPLPHDRLGDPGIISTAVVMRRERPLLRRQSQGLGFIVSGDGYILTNHHVVNGATKVTAALADGREFEAKVVGADQAADVAVVKIDADGLPALKLADSDSLQVGDWVVAIGNSMGLGRTLCAGLVTGKGRSGAGIAEIEDYIQTNLNMHLGDTGGPLLDLDGKVVAINAAIVGRERGVGISLAIPVRMAKLAYEQIVETGTVERGFLGVAFQDITPRKAHTLGLETATGVIVTGVVADSAAQEAGIKRNDVIEQCNGLPVEPGSRLLQLVASLRPGQKVELVVVRDGKRQTLTVTLDKRPSGRERAPDDD